MFHYKLILAYDGTDYYGWQVQPHLPTIQHTLEHVYERVFDSSVSLTGASRTDAGVHALGQVVLASCESRCDPQTLARAWQGALPATILIRSLEPVSADFYPRRNVQQKTYYYHFFTRRPLPFVARYGWFVHAPVDLARLRAALALFVGTHDFRSFCTGDEMGESTVRTVDQIELQYLRRYGVYRIVVRGPGFMRHMIRRIVGAAMTVATANRRSIDEIRSILDARNPNNALLNAPAQGLLLKGIIYDRGNG